MDINQIARAKQDDVRVEVFNDNKDGEPVFRREHLIMYQVTFVTGGSLMPFTGDLRKWDGSRDICISSKNKRKINFVGLDLPTPVHSTAMIDPKDASFRGVAFIKTLKPDPNLKLYPVAMTNRTFIG